MSDGQIDQEARAVALRFVDALNAQDFAAVAACLAPDFENHQLPFGVIAGHEAYMAHLRKWYDAYPDLHVEVRSCFAVDGVVCLEVIEYGTRSGEFNGAPPSGELETYFGCDVLEVRDGLITIFRGYWDYSVATGLPAPRAGGHRPEDSRYFQPRRRA